MIYLDHAASTPLDPDVLAEMMPFLTHAYGNASSRTHAAGWAASDAVERARGEVAALLGADGDEIYFTSGATEANALALYGLAAEAGSRRHIVASTLEHKSVIACLESLAGRGFAITWVGPRADGRTDADDVLAAVRADTAFVTLMAVNNEVGVINPVAAVASRVARDFPLTLVHSDATQGVSRLDLRALGADVASLSAHKLYGPKGVGAMFVRRAVRGRVGAVMRGGGQERGLRGGTLNVPGIVGFGRAAALALARREGDAAHIADLAHRLVDGVMAAWPGARENVARTARVPGQRVPARAARERALEGGRRARRAVARGGVLGRQR